MMLRRTLVILLLACTVAACGQKGPLYRPADEVAGEQQDEEE